MSQNEAEVLKWMGLHSLKKSLEFQIKRAKQKGENVTILEKRLEAVTEAMGKP